MELSPIGTDLGGAVVLFVVFLAVLVVSFIAVGTKSFLQNLKDERKIAEIISRQSKHRFEKRREELIASIRDK